MGKKKKTNLPVVLEGLDAEELGTALELLQVEARAIVRIAEDGHIVSLTGQAARILALEEGDPLFERLNEANAGMLREALRMHKEAYLSDQLGAQRIYDISAKPVKEGALLLLTPREPQSLLDARIHMDARDCLQLVTMAENAIAGNVQKYAPLRGESAALREALKGSPAVYRSVRRDAEGFYNVLKREDEANCKLLREAVLKLQRTLLHAERIQDSAVPGSKPIFVEGDLAETCRNAVREFRKVSGTEVNVQVPRSLKAVFDPDWIEGALLNLLTNAARAGEVKVSASYQNGNFLLSVEDNGEGIEPDALKHLYNAWSGEFDPEGYLDTDLRPGTGLPMVWTAAAYHNGRLFYEELAKGGVFRLSFPDGLLPELPEVRSAAIPGSGFSIAEIELSVL